MTDSRSRTRRIASGLIPIRVKRFLTAFRYYRNRLGLIVRWLFTSRETTNFTYDITPLNREHLTAFVAEITGADFALAQQYVDELESDADLKTHLMQSVDEHPEHRHVDRIPRYGRRAGWYALVRILKPRVVVETGVDKGLGTAVLAAALRRNQSEGFDGRVYAMDINPQSCWLLRRPYRDYAEIMMGDSIASIQAFPHEIDLFIHDSDHSAQHERNEYRTIQNKLSQKAVILSDNSHVTDELLQFSLSTGRRYLFFKEEPAGHWYPGAGIGAAFSRKSSVPS